MKKNESREENRHYLFFGGWLRLEYAYVDPDRNCDYVADSLFYRRKTQAERSE